MERIYSAIFKQDEETGETRLVVVENAGQTTPKKEKLAAKRPVGSVEHLRSLSRRAFREVRRLHKRTSAIRDAARSFLRCFMIAYSGKAGLALLFTILKRPGIAVPTPKNRQTLVDVVTSKDTLRFATFFGTLLGAYKALLHLLTYVRRRVVNGARVGDDGVFNGRRLRDSIAGSGTSGANSEGSDRGGGVVLRDSARRKLSAIALNDSERIDLDVDEIEGVADSVSQEEDEDEDEEGNVGGEGGDGSDGSEDEEDHDLNAVVVTNKSGSSEGASIEARRAASAAWEQAAESSSSSSSFSREECATGLVDEDGFHRTDKVIAGFLSGAALLLDAPERRKTLALYAFVRGFDVVLHAMQNKGALPSWKYQSHFLFSLVNVPIMYGFLYEKDILEPWYYRWIHWMGQTSDKSFRYLWLDEWDAQHREVDPLPFRSSAGHFYEKNRELELGADWFYGLKRAASVYFPVHLLSLVLRWRTLAKLDPKTTLPLLRRFVRNMALSSAFLTTYQYLVKSTAVTLRDVCQLDHGWHGILAGATTGLACLFESPGRVNELMLYCMPKGLDATFIALRRRGYVSTLRNGEVLIFMAAMAALLGTDRREYKRTYRMLIDFLLPQ